MSEWKKAGEVESKPPKIIPTDIIAIAQEKYAAIQTRFSLDHNKTTAQVTGNTESLISK
jgi:hypothetical protein